VREQHIEACAKGEVEAQLQLVDRLRDEFREMPTCGALGGTFVLAAVEMLVSVTTNRPIAPSGFSYQGSGFYGAGTIMGLQARLARDTSFGKAGDPVPFDLFDTSEYFGTFDFAAQVEVGVSLDTGGVAESHASGSITVKSITSPGPALELFGIDPNKPGATYDVQTLAANMGSSVTFGLEVKIGTILDLRGVTYHLTTTPKELSAMYEGEPLKWEMVDIEAVNGAQTASLEKWDIAYVAGHGGYMDGSIVMRVDGDFTYYVKYDFPKQLDPNIYITCDPPAP
jgi:hypothetical protein